MTLESPHERMLITSLETKNSRIERACEFKQSEKCNWPNAVAQGRVRIEKIILLEMLAQLAEIGLKFRRLF